MNNQEILRLALVGCGNIARAHWWGIQNHAPRIQVTACVDSDFARASAMAEETGGEAFSSLEDALTHGEFDAVDLMLPHDAHEHACMLAFEAKKHVCLEKPISTDIDSAERILHEGKKAGIVLMVAEQAQYWPDIHKARELLDEGKIGQILTAHASFYDPTRIDPNEPVPWRFIESKSGGGVCMDGGAHWIRPMRIMLGEIEEVVAATGNHLPNREVESYGLSLLRFRSGTIATFKAILTAAATGPIIDFRITGSEGEIVIERGREGRLLLFNQENRQGLEVMSASKGKSISYGVELEDFCAAVLDGRELAASAEYALGELRTAKAMYRSVESGRWESVWA